MRERRIVAILGGPGSGKSTLAKALVGAARDRGQRVRIVDPARQFRGGEMPTDVEAWLAERRDARDADLLLLDDADAYVPTQPKPSSPFRDLWLRNRWWKMDVLVTARRAQSLSPTFLSAVQFLYVFRLSPADVAGRARLEETCGKIEIPTEPYKFILVDVFAGTSRPGRVFAGGGYRVDP